MLDKKRVISAFVILYKDKIADIRKSLESTRKCAIDAPGSNVSHSDTSKFQYSNLALGIEKRMKEADEILKLLEFMLENGTTGNDVVSVGSLVSLRDIDTGELARYLLIGREGGGDFVIVDDAKVVIIYAKAPLARMIKGKEKGEEIEFLKKTLEITEIQ